MNKGTRVGWVGVAALALGWRAVGIAAGEPPVPAGYDQNYPVFRGPNGSANCARKNVPAEWNESAGRNILWKTKIPLGGLSSPVVWADRICLSGATKEKREVYCLSAKDGSLLWTGTYESSPDASTDYQVYESLDALMHAAPSPAVDGKRVYAMFANGEIVAFDLQTGKLVWSKVAGNPGGNQYGLSNSLLIYGDSVIVHFEGDDSTLTRMKGATGEVVWKADRKAGGWASPILIKAPDGKYQVVTHGDPETAGWDPETGKKLWSHDLCSGDIAPSPIYAGGQVMVNFAGNGMFAVDPTGKSKVTWKLEELQEGTFSDASSMVSDGELAYHFHKDVLSCVDVKTGKIVYEKTLDNTTSYASPMVVDDRLYLFCGTVTMVAKTGREFELLKTCSLKESCDVSPAIADGRIFMRTESHLYALGE